MTAGNTSELPVDKCVDMYFYVYVKMCVEMLPVVDWYERECCQQDSAAEQRSIDTCVDSCIGTYTCQHTF